MILFTFLFHFKSHSIFFQTIEKQEFLSGNLDDQKVMSFITSFVFPPPIQKLIREVNEDNVHSHPLIRFHILSLIRSLLLKIKSILKDYASSHHAKSTFHLQIDNFLNKVSIHFQNRLNSSHLN